MIYTGNNGQKYIIDKELKQGGEGKVCTVSGQGNIVAKIYHSNVVTAELESKIRYMTNNPPSKIILDQIAWPLDCLKDDTGKFVGFVMPKLDTDAELNDVYKYPMKKIKLSNDQKLVIAINICKVISEIHRAGYVFGDFNPCNIGVNLSTGHVAFFDTDSYHIYDKTTRQTYRCAVCLNGYVAPEVIAKCKNTNYKNAPLPTFTQESDRFSLAIHIFKLLFNGYTPYNGILETERVSQASPGIGNVAVEQDNYCFKPGNKPMSVATPPLDSFPQDIQRLFTKAFIDGRNNLALRPRAEEWDMALTNYRSQLIPCQNNSMHSYYNHLQNCPYCEADARYNLMMQMNAVYGSSGSSAQISFNPPTIPNPTASNRTGSVGTVSAGSTYVPKSTASSSNSLQGSISTVRNNTKMGFKKKLKISISCICILIVVALGIYSAITANRINNAINLIEELPETIKSYDLYDQDISSAYSAYSELTEHQQGFVKNSDKLLTIMTGYNQYKVDTLLSTASGVSVDTVSTGTVLQDTVVLYNALTGDQKALLSDEDISKLDNYVIAADVISRINTINSNLVQNYSTLNDALKQYDLLDEQYTSLVYNYGLINTFHETMGIYEKLSFTEVEGGYAISVANGTTIVGELVIPEEYDGMPIVEISSNGFANQKQMTSVVVPNSVKVINGGAFYNCIRLQKMSLPFTGRSIDASAYNAVFGFVFGFDTVQDHSDKNPIDTFINIKIGSHDTGVWQYTRRNNTYYTESLETYQSMYYHIPSTLSEVTITKQTEVKTAAFNGCENIEKIMYSNGLTSDIGTAAFQNCKSLKSFNSEKEREINLTGSGSVIGSCAFLNCKEVRSYVLGDNIVTIEDHAFSGCENIEQVYFTDTVRKIGNYAFEKLKLVEIINVPNSVQTIGQGAFYGCNKIEKITLPFTGRSMDATAYNAVLGYIFGFDTVQDHSDKNPIDTFINIKIGSHDTGVWQYTRRNNTYYTESLATYQSMYYYIPLTLKEVIITKQTDIKIAAFNNCTMLEKITFVNGISSQGECAFQNCTAEIIQDVN